MNLDPNRFVAWQPPVSIVQRMTGPVMVRSPINQNFTPPYKGKDRPPKERDTESLPLTTPPLDNHHKKGMKRHRVEEGNLLPAKKIGPEKKLLTCNRPILSRKHLSLRHIKSYTLIKNRILHVAKVPRTVLAHVALNG